MMDYLEPNVVIVDDVLLEYEGIYDYYSSKGIGCKVFNPDLYEGDEFPTTPFSDVNIIYLDLHYSNIFNSERCVSWVRHIVKPKSFYILIMWTKDESKAEEVSVLLKTNNVLPFLTIIKNKSEYQNISNFDFTLLFEQINNELNSTPALQEILIWKKTVKYSFNEIIGNLTKNPANIVDKLKKIIISHGGISIKDSEDNINKRNILFDALDTVLISNTRKNTNTDISQLNSETLYNLEATENAETDNELNSWFHFKMTNNISEDLVSPGLISKNNHKLFKKLYSIQDDPKIEMLLVNQKREGVQFEDIVVLISRPCDLAQKKYGKNLKLLSGIIVYKAKRNANGKFNYNGKPMDSIKTYDHLYWDSENDDVTVILDLRYSFSVPKDIFIDQTKFENLKIINKDLLSEIQVEYSSYCSRLGITQII
jgi:hypothetical protein